MPCKIKNLSLIAALFLFSACSPRLVNYGLNKPHTVEDLGLVSQHAYQEAMQAKNKSAILAHSKTGIHYSSQCLKQDPKKNICLYYNVVNQGLYIKNHIPNYQNSLKKMVQNCETLLQVDPGYQFGGCYRILGNIYSQAPAFSLNENAVTQDLSKSQAYLEKAVAVAPQYALNHLFLARTLEMTGEKQNAQNELAKFDGLITPDLDKDYPEWKEERDTLAQKLH
jgi:tetratricopeptide (TPR) repeat protein